MKILVINESGRANHEYYHYTNVNGLIGILQSNKMIGSLESEGILDGKITVSFSRIGKGTQIDSKMVSSPAVVKIIIDGEKLADNYKIVPYDWYGGDSRGKGKSEYEEAVVLNDKYSDRKKVSVDINNGKEFFCRVIFVRDSYDIFEVKNIIVKKGKVEKVSDYKYRFPDGYIYTIDYLDDGTDLNVEFILKPSDNSNKVIKTKILKGHLKLNNENSAINNIRKYIKGVQFSDKLKENDKWMYYVWTPKEYLERALSNENSTGLSGGSHSVPHNIKTFEDLVKFLNGFSVSIGYYKSPLKGYKRK